MKPSSICPFFAVFLTSVASVMAESPSAHPWDAHWIGPSVVAPVDLTGAAWIWTNEAGVDPTRNAKSGKRFFARGIEISGDAAVTSASAIFAADNHFKLSVNGREIGGGDDWQHPSTFDLTDDIQVGKNRIIVQAENDPDSGAINAAGLIGKIRIERKNAPALEVATGGDWKSAEYQEPKSLASVQPDGVFGSKTSTPNRVEPTSWACVKSIGELGSGPWAGVATGSAASAQSNQWTSYRKAFSLPEKPQTAVARIAVDSKYWLWLNGKMVVREGGLKRGPNPQDTYYDAVDLAPYLVKGENQVAVLAWYFGKDGFSHKSSGKAGFLFEMEAGGTKLLSDTSWKIRRHPAFGAAGNTPNFRLAESSVHFDARLDMPGWTNRGFDDADWHSPEDFGAALTAPWNRLWEREIPQWKDFGLKDYENAATLPKEGTGNPITAKLPYNAQITPWLKISAPAGLLIRMGTDNSANEIHAEYLTKDGEQEFETPAWMSGHAVIYQIPPGVKILGLKYRESGFDTTFTGTFSCDNEFLNKLWKKCERTLYINMRDSFFDCPDRERAQWWGDIVIQLGQVFYSFDPRSHSLIRKCMYNLCNWQRSSKTMFAPIPAGNWDKELPQQMLASIGQYGFWTYYFNTGDTKTLADVYPHVKAYLSIWQTDGDALVVHRSGENGWDWADWGNNVDIRVLDNAWYCLALEGAANMADVLKQPQDAANFRKQRESIIAAVNRKFWNGSAYRDPGYNGATDDRAQGMAVIASIAAPDKFPAIKAVLAKEFHASPYIEKYILESLFLMGDPTAAMARMEKRYKEMVDSETSTLWELFTRDGTLNHAWTGGPLTLMFQYLAGVSPTSAGYATFCVKPQLGNIRRVETGFDTVRGHLTVTIQREEKSFRLKLTSPEKVPGTVCIPMADDGYSAVRVGGRPLWLNGKPNGEVPGVVPMGEKDGYATFNVTPGIWEFEAR